MKKVVVIGSGFAGMSAACFMAKAGWEVTVLEKNEMPGGRARKLEEGGFTFDMGPSWYWMPDVFEHFFLIALEKRCPIIIICRDLIHPTVFIGMIRQWIFRPIMPL